MKTNADPPRRPDRRVCMFTVQPVLFDARVQKEACALRDAGHTVQVVYVEDPRSTGSVPGAEGAWATYREEMRGIVTRPVLLRTREWRWLPKPLRKAAQAVELSCRFAWIALATRAEVFHCHDLTPGLFCILGKYVHRARLVYDAHELEVRAASAVHRAAQAVYERGVVACADAVIAVNEPIAGIMRRRYGRDVEVVANRPPLVRAAALRRGLLRAAAGLPEHARIILYAGFLVRERRGIETVVRTLPLLDDDVHFVIMGVGRIEEFRAYLERYAAENAVATGRIRFIGPFPPRDVVHYLNGADVSVALYRPDSENAEINAPNKLFQSIMARVPILATNNRTLPGYVLDNAIGPIGEVADPHDPVQVADKLRVMLDPDRQRLYRRNADALAESVCWESEAARLVGLFEQRRGLAARPDEPAPIAARAGTG